MKKIVMLSLVLTLISVLFVSVLSNNSYWRDEIKIEKKIKVNQLGYRINDPKIAFVKGNDLKYFEIINASTNKKVFEGEINSPMSFDKATGDNVYKLDFSALTDPGEYYISVPSINEASFDFKISNEVYNECLKKTAESFYYQRCGIEINNGTKWRHPECHIKPALFFGDQSKHLNADGGWHDAGDYNKFVPSTAVSVAFLLYAYQDNENLFYDGQLNIPGSENSVPDILDEAIWSLKWLLKMQREDGGVFHKVSIKKWTGEHLPHKETDEQYVFKVSSASTAGAVAVAALGSRILSNYDKLFSSKLLKYAVNGWDFLLKNPGNIPPAGFKNPQGVSGGEYNDESDSDERLWASVELYRLTGSNEYLSYFLSNYKKVGGPNYTISWKNTANFAFYSFLKLDSPGQVISVPFEEARSIIFNNMNNYGQDLLNRINSGGYKCALKTNEYYWGSNSVVAGYAFDLINIYYSTNHQSYKNAALDQLNYLIGTNTFNISFVTGIGSNPVRYPYHQFSMIQYNGDPVPGLLVGGPNSYSKLDGKIIDKMPGKCYEDNEKNYYVNEVAINYTAPLVYAASFFSVGNKKIIKKSLSSE